MRLEFRYPADDDERYAPGAWDSAVGTTVTIPGGQDGTIIAAEVVEDGQAVNLTVEVDRLPPLFDPVVEGLSIEEDDR